MTTKEFIEKAIDSGETLRLSVLRGVLQHPSDESKAVEFRFTNSGKPVVNGSLLCEEQYEHEGETRTDKYYVFFSAFDSVAEQISENLSAGDTVTLVTKRSRRKANERWYDNDTVVLFEK